MNCSTWWCSTIACPHPTPQFSEPSRYAEWERDDLSIRQSRNKNYRTGLSRYCRMIASAPIQMTRINTKPAQMQLFQRSAFGKIGQNPWSRACGKTRVDGFEARPAVNWSSRPDPDRKLSTSHSEQSDSPEGRSAAAGLPARAPSRQSRWRMTRLDAADVPRCAGPVDLRCAGPRRKRTPAGSDAPAGVRWDWIRT